MQVYLSKKEVAALIDTSSEWCEIMGSGDENCRKCVTERMEEGLGSALYKLSKGLLGQRTYKKWTKDI